MSKWDRLVKYLNTTNAKPESVEALIKNTWKPRGAKKTKTTKTGDHAIIKKHGSIQFVMPSTTAKAR